MNYKETIKKLTFFLDKSLKNTSCKSFIVGISGGLDSAVVSALCSRVNNATTFALLMPTQFSSKTNFNDALKHCEKFNISYEIINLDDIIKSFENQLQSIDNDKLRKGNLLARIRMCLLYDYSAKLNGVVVGTSNLSERMLGYGTIYGDLACAFNPIGELFKTEIFELAKYLDIDEAIISKAPSADLWPNQSDEVDLGYSYKELDEVLKYYYPKKINDEFKINFDENIINLVEKKMKQNSFKLEMPKIANIK